MDKLMPLSEKEIQNVKSTFAIFQKALMSKVEQYPLPFDETVKGVLGTTKVFLGSSIRGGHIAGYRDLKVDQNLKIFFILRLATNKQELPMAIELQPPTGEQ